MYEIGANFVYIYRQWLELHSGAIHLYSLESKKPDATACRTAYAYSVPNEGTYVLAC
jgi:hypothetical protein